MDGPEDSRVSVRPDQTSPEECNAQTIRLLVHENPTQDSFLFSFLDTAARFCRPEEERTHRPVLSIPSDDDLEKIR